MRHALCPLPHAQSSNLNPFIASEFQFPSFPLSALSHILTFSTSQLLFPPSAFPFPNSHFRLSHFLLCLTFSPSHLLTFSTSQLLFPPSAFPFPNSHFRLSHFLLFLTFSHSHLLTFSTSQLLTFCPFSLPPSPSHLLTFCPFPLPPFPPSALRLPTYDFFKSGYPPATPTLSTRSCRAGCCPGRNEYRPLRYAAAGG